MELRVEIKCRARDKGVVGSRMETFQARIS
jgi:hypothetical protein